MKSLKWLKRSLLAEYISELEIKVNELDVENATLQTLVNEYERIPPAPPEQPADFSQLDSHAGRDELARDVEKNLGLPVRETPYTPQTSDGIDWS